MKVTKRLLIGCVCRVGERDSKNIIMSYDDFKERGSPVHVGTVGFVQVEVLIQAWTDKTYISRMMPLVG